MNENIRRRTALQSIGAGIGIATLGTGLAGAGGHSGGGNNPCEGCGTLLTKYEFDEDAGEFVFEKGRDNLGIDGDEFEFSITETNEDGEPLCIEVDSVSAGGVSGGIYDFSCATVKSGQDTDRPVEGTWATEFDHCQDKYAISNFALCIEEAFMQIDMGTGLTPPNWFTEDWSTATLYDPSGFIGAATSDLSGVATNGPKRYVENAGASEFWQFNGDDTVTVEFNVLGDEPMDLHIVSTEMPGPWRWDDIPWSKPIDLANGTFDPDDNPHSMTVDVPTV